MIDTYKFSTLEYKRPDLEARRAKLAEWKNAAVHAESYAALRALIAALDSGHFYGRLPVHLEESV